MKSSTFYPNVQTVNSHTHTHNDRKEERDTFPYLRNLPVWNMDSDFWMLPWLRLNHSRRGSVPAPNKGLGYALLSVILTDKECLGGDSAPYHPSLREVRGSVTTCAISLSQHKITSGV